MTELDAGCEFTPKSAKTPKFSPPRRKRREQILESGLNPHQDQGQAHPGSGTQASAHAQVVGEPSRGRPLARGIGPNKVALGKP